MLKEAFFAVAATYSCTETPWPVGRFTERMGAAWELLLYRMYVGNEPPPCVVAARAWCDGERSEPPGYVKLLTSFFGRPFLSRLIGRPSGSVRQVELVQD